MDLLNCPNRQFQWHNFSLSRGRNSRMPRGEVSDSKGLTTEKLPFLFEKIQTTQMDSFSDIKISFPYLEKCPHVSPLKFTFISQKNFFTCYKNSHLLNALHLSLINFIFFLFTFSSSTLYELWNVNCAWCNEMCNIMWLKRKLLIKLMQDATPHESDFECHFSSSTYAISFCKFSPCEILKFIFSGCEWKSPWKIKLMACCWISNFQRLWCEMMTLSTQIGGQWDRSCGQKIDILMNFNNFQFFTLALGWGCAEVEALMHYDSN